MFGDPSGLEYRRIETDDGLTVPNAAETPRASNAAARTEIESGVRGSLRQKSTSTYNNRIRASTVLPGVNEPGIESGLSSGIEKPLANFSDLESFDDLRFVEEADALAADYARTLDEETPTVEEALVEARRKDEAAAAVAEAARKLREESSDVSMQGKAEFSVDDQSRIIDFKFVDIGEMEKARNEDGVLGLVRVIDSGLEDDYEFDESGHIVVAGEGEDESSLMQWTAEGTPIDPALIGAGAMPDSAALNNLGAAAEGLMNRFANVQTSAESQSEFLNSMSARANFSVAKVLDQGALGRSDGPGNKQGNRERQISMQQFMQIAFDFLLRPQVFLGVLLAVGLLFGVSRLSRFR
ncbi:MAG: hypothetical protein KDE14_14010 [Rhodobacteraceae bacterium]|nr:hypothetical protein [Paracoccaceae bacterium]